MNKKILAVIEDVKAGKPVIVIDAKNREDEADLCLAAEMCNEENLAFCMLNARGLMCLTIPGEVIDRLGIPPMPTNNLDPLQTPFACPIDASPKHQTQTGMSVQDRLKTISVVLDDNSKNDDLIIPGHLQVLRPRKNLLHERNGHTENFTALLELSGFVKKIGMIQELINKDGTMSREKDTKKFAKKHGLKIISTDEIKEAWLEMQKNLGK